MSPQEVTLPPDTASPSRARRFAEEALNGDIATLDVLLLLLSEVVTNAVLHAGSDVTVRILRNGPKVRVEVADHSKSGPVRRSFSENAGTGRGMILVEELADDWGMQPSEDGKVVWFEVAASG